MQLLTLLKKLACFGYGTSYSVALTHHPQSRNIAYTIGGLILFVTAPFLFAGTVYLIKEQLEFIPATFVRWVLIVLISAVITTAIIWVERALLVLADALWPHWIPQFVMLILRLSMVFLFSTVVAKKWVINSYEGPIKVELVLMKAEAFEEEKSKAATAFDLASLEQKSTSSSALIKELEHKLSVLPIEITQLSKQLEACKVSANALWIERNELLQSGLDIIDITTKAKAKSYECKLKEKTYITEVKKYRTPLEEQLAAERMLSSEVKKSLVDSEKAAKQQTAERAKELTTALELSGSNEKAFSRVRDKNPAIDNEIRNKTLLLSALEILPLLLKLLTWNSPISAQTKALLQQESAVFRAALKDSINSEKSSTVTPNYFGFSPTVSPQSTYSSTPPNYSNTPP